MGVGRRIVPEGHCELPSLSHLSSQEQPCQTYVSCPPVTTRTLLDLCSPLDRHWVQVPRVAQLSGGFHPLVILHQLRTRRFFSASPAEISTRFLYTPPSQVQVTRYRVNLIELLTKFGSVRIESSSPPASRCRDISALKPQRSSVDGRSKNAWSHVKRLLQQNPTLDGSRHCITLQSEYLPKIRVRSLDREGPAPFRRSDGKLFENPTGMDNQMDIDEKPRPPSGSYGSHPASRLSSADAPPSHNHYAYASPANVHPGPPPPMNPPSQPPPSWFPPPSPYTPHQSDRSHPDAAPHPVSAPAAYGSAQRVYPTPASEHPYQPRPGSISGNSRSPIEAPHQSHPAHMNGHEGPHPNHQMPVERHGYGPETPGGGPPHGLPYPTAPEPMSAHSTAPLGPHSYPPPGSGYGTPSYDSYYSGMVPGGPQKRKPVRASQACDTCRNRKAKCDEGRPCSHCKENNLECQYRELPIPKQDRHVREQLDKLDLVIKKQDELQELLLRNREATERNERKTDYHQAQLEAINHHFQIPNTIKVSNDETIKKETDPPPHVPDSSSTSQAQKEAPAPVDPQLSVSQSADLTIPIQHTTYAHKLLLWPSIAELLRDYRLKIGTMQGDQLTEYYVDRLELTRGLPRLFGRGQGEDRNDPGKGPSSPADSSSSRSDDQESISSSDALTWGYSLSFPAPVIEGPDHPGGQKSGGELNLDAAVIDDMCDSYLTHIHILHPFLNRKVLAGMVAKFKRRYSKDRPPKYSEHRLGSMSRKRKLDDEISSPPEASSSRPQLSERRSSASQPPHDALERSTSNIIILLVLALGKICKRTDKLPGPVPADSQTSPSSHPSQTSPSSHPSYASPSSHAHTHISPDYQVMNINTPTPAPDESNASSAPTPQTNEKRQKRNLDVIPGFAYYAVAAGMLGEHNCENRIAEAQACLLAGLYAGQLACVAASHKWISSACSIVQILLKS